MVLYPHKRKMHSSRTVCLYNLFLVCLFVCLTFPFYLSSTLPIAYTHTPRRAPTIPLLLYLICFSSRKGKRRTHSHDTTPPRKILFVALLILLLLFSFATRTIFLLFNLVANFFKSLFSFSHNCTTHTYIHSAHLFFICWFYISSMCLF